MIDSPSPGVAPHDSAGFIGREAFLAAIHQYLADPVDPRMLTILGARLSGKSFLFSRFGELFDDDFLAVRPSPAGAIPDETAWITALAAATSAMLADRGSPVALDPPALASAAEARFWLADHALPRVLRRIRDHRRLVWLIDDAERLVDAVQAGRLPADHFDFLHGLLDRFPQLRMVGSLSSEREGDLPRLAPLAAPDLTIQLRRPTTEEASAYLAGVGLALEPELVARAIRLTGRHPRLLTLFGRALAAQAEGDHEAALTRAAAQAYEAASADFQRQWGALGRDEQVVLAAMASAEGPHPAPATAPQITRYLVETDHPLDQTTVGATLRSLTHAGLLVPDEHGGFALEAGLFRRWVQDNGRPGAHGARANRSLAASEWFILALLVLIGALALLASGSAQPDRGGVEPAPATVTSSAQGQ
jgi:hypothetical protein